MNEPENIVAFHESVRLVLLHLWDHFPRPRAIDSRHLLEQLPEIYRIQWPPGPDNIVAATIRYLAAEGYLRHGAGDRPTDVTFPNSVLTARGFTALNRPLKSLSNEPGLMQRLRENLSLSDLAATVGLFFQP